MKFNKKQRYEILEGNVSTIFNVLLVAIKIYIFVITNSISILADLVHSASDFITSIIVVISAYMSAQKPDKEHPFGHGRISYIASLIISIFIILAGAEFIFKSIERIINSETISIPSNAIYLLLITILIKFLNFLYAYFLSKKVNSITIKADTTHHLSDVLTSLIVLGGFILNIYGIKYIDSITGIIVSLIVIYVGIKIFKESSYYLLGSPPSKNLINRIRNIVLKIDKNIVAIHDIIINSYGTYKIISLHIELPYTLSFIEAHTIASKVEEVLGKELNGWIIVHCDPINNSNRYYKKIERILIKKVKDIPFLETYHNLRIIEDKNNLTIIFEITLKPEIDNTTKKNIVKELKKIIKQECRDIKNIIIEIDPLFTY